MFFTIIIFMLPLHVLAVGVEETTIASAGFVGAVTVAVAAAAAAGTVGTSGDAVEKKKKKKKKIASDASTDSGDGGDASTDSGDAADAGGGSDTPDPEFADKKKKKKKKKPKSEPGFEPGFNYNDLLDSIFSKIGRVNTEPERLRETLRFHEGGKPPHHFTVLINYKAVLTEVNRYKLQYPQFSFLNFIKVEEGHVKPPTLSGHNWSQLTVYCGYYRDGIMTAWNAYIKKFVVCENCKRLTCTSINRNKGIFFLVCANCKCSRKVEPPK